MEEEQTKYIRSKEIAQQHFAEKYVSFILKMKMKQSMRFYYLREIIEYVGTLEEHDYFNCTNIQHVYFEQAENENSKGVSIRIVYGVENEKNNFDEIDLFSHYIYFDTFHQMIQYVLGYNEARWNIKNVITSRTNYLPQSKHYKRNLEIAEDLQREFTNEQ